MLKLFKSFSFGSVLALLLALVAARIGGALGVPPLPAEEGGIGYVLVLHWLGTSGYLVQVILGVHILLQALLLNSIVNSDQSGLDRTLLPALVYIILSSLSLHFFANAAIIWGLSFLAIALFNFYRISHKSDVSVQIFNVGFFTAIAALFFQPFLIFMIFFTLRMVALKSLKLRDFVQLFTGTTVAYFLSWSLSYLLDYSDLFFMLQAQQQFVFIDRFEEVSSYTFWITMGIFFVLGSVSLLFYGELTSKASLIFKRKLSLLYEMMLFSLALLIFQRSLNFQDIMVVFPFLGTLVGLGFSAKRNLMLAELLHLMLWAVLLFLQYYFKG